MRRVFLDPNHPNGDGIYAYGTYRPWSWHKSFGGDWSSYPAHSGKLLDLKKNDARAVQYFFNIVVPTINSGIAIAVVPSHDPTSVVSGTRTLANRLAAIDSRHDATGALVRTQKIAKLATGGDRSLSVHLGSVVVPNPQLVRGRTVLLLDDITTSGHSLLACRKLLLDAGAEHVECAALGRTG